MASDEEYQRMYQNEKAVMQMSREQDAGLTKWQLFSDDIIAQIEHDLRGDKWVMDETDPEKGEWKCAEEEDAYMNEQGIRRTIGLSHSILNKNTYLSALREEHIYQLYKNFSIDFALMVVKNVDKFGIDLTNLWIIHDIVMTPIFTALMRALNAGERQFLSKSERRIERIVEVPQQGGKRRKMLGF
jgi:hypothetical protein